MTLLLGTSENQSSRHTRDHYENDCVAGNLRKSIAAQLIHFAAPRFKRKWL